MASETVFKSHGELIYDNILSSIKLLAGDKFKLKEPFIYNDGKKDIGCIILERRIDLIYNG